MEGEELELSQAFADIARSLLSEMEVEETLIKIAEIAVSLIDGCEASGIDIVEKGEIRAVAPTSEIARRIDAIQVEVGEGPCLEAIRHHEIFHSDDLSVESRWPEFARRAYEETGVRSIMGFRLYIEGDTMGALDLYSTEPNAFDEETEVIGSVLAAHAGVALSTARMRQNLKEATRTRDLIGQAKGMLMERRGIGEDEAFEILTEASQRLNVKLREIAQKVVDSSDDDLRL